MILAPTPLVGESWGGVAAFSPRLDQGADPSVFGSCISSLLATAVLLLATALLPITAHRSRPDGIHSSRYDPV